ncbi:single-pass membrane and coiled-coil domain-containing protein 1 [Guaruba guarouba]
MAKASISLRSLNETLNRVETKLQNLETLFTDLDSSLQTLAHKFDLQAEMMEKELSQDALWIPEGSSCFPHTGRPSLAGLPSSETRG